MLQFITHRNTHLDEVEGAALALKGGCRWIQLRMKDADDDEFMRAAEKISPLCKAAGATFILDDRVHLVRRLGADGVHLGKNDMPIAEARRLLPDKIIGATANTIEDMEKAVADGADYIGLGPFRFTTTKARLSTILGIDGSRQIMKKFRKTSTIPVVAIGGINADDIPELMETGISGIAISGTILNSPDPIETTKQLIKIIES